MPIINRIQKELSNIKLESFEAEHDPDLCGDIDYLGWINAKAFGIQIKPVTAKSNFGNYSVTERMKSSFNNFTRRFEGKVFIVFSLDGEIGNVEVLSEIEKEAERLKNL